MKYVMIVATICSCVLVCTVSCFRSPQPGEIPPHLFFRKVADHHPIAKRQTIPPELQDAIDCNIIALDYQCSSGFFQGLADIALACGNDSYARDLSNACARNEGGGFCVTEVFHLSIDESLSVGVASCTGAVSSGFCPSSCSSFLQSVSSRLGCCINT